MNQLIYVNRRTNCEPDDPAVGRAAVIAPASTTPVVLMPSAPALSNVKNPGKRKRRKRKRSGKRASVQGIEYVCLCEV